MLAALDFSEEERSAHDLIAPEFDRTYYLLTNQDVCDTGMEPLHHYVRSGRWEGRRPAHWFHPAYYDGAYPEAGRSGLDLFSYFLRYGRAQGHATLRRSGPARQAIQNARPPGERAASAGPQMVMHMQPEVLLHELRARLTGAAGVTVSLSHDAYLNNVGGVQILVASEQAALNALGECYLHLAPVIPLPTLSPDGLDAHYLHVTVNGVLLGAATAGDVLGMMAATGTELPGARRLVVHCLLGHVASFPAELYRLLHAPAGGAPEAVFWVHDYESVCVGYNLLRNDAAYCGAPPAGSAACGTCVYGGERPGHLAAMTGLFGAVPFRVAAPSATALALWLSKSGLPHRSAEVGAVLRWQRTSHRRRVGAGAERGTAGNPVTVAFAGHPAAHKGWGAFVEIAAELEGSGAYRLLHLSASGDPGLPGVGHVAVRVGHAAPDAMTAAFVAMGVDLVLVLSPWPETFCIVASEALAAGADVLTLECSGNVADLVRQTGRGRVFADADGVAAYLTSAQAIQDVRVRQRDGAEAGRISLSGTTAALPPPARCAAQEAAPTPAGTT